MEIELLIAALLGGSGGVLVKGLLEPFESKRKHRYELEASRHRAEFDKLLKAQSDLANANQQHLPAAAAAAHWTDAMIADTIGPDVDYQDPEHFPGELHRSLASVLGGLREIRMLHPSSAIRTRAEKLCEALKNFYGDTSRRQDHKGGFPGWHDQDDLQKHYDLAIELVELLHRESAGGLLPASQVAAEAKLPAPES